MIPEKEEIWKAAITIFFMWFGSPKDPVEVRKSEKLLLSLDEQQLLDLSYGMSAENFCIIDSALAIVRGKRKRGYW